MDQISQEEYVRLALMGWNDAYNMVVMEAKGNEEYNMYLNMTIN